MPSVLATSAHCDGVDGQIVPSAPPRLWRTWAPSLGCLHAQRSPRTPRSCALTRRQTMETLLESVARQSPLLYIQAGAGL
jgi:hypothetical protein